MHLTRPLATGMLLLTTLIWGGGFVASQKAIDCALSAPWILLFRFSLGSAVVFLCFSRRILRASARAAGRGVLAGVLLFLGFLTQVLGQSRTSVPNAAFITTTNVLIVPLLVWLITRRRPGARVFWLCLMSMAGVLLLTMDGKLRIAPGPGDALVLLCAFFFAAHIVFLDLACATEDSVAVAFWQLLACAVLAGLSVPFFPGTPSLPQLREALPALLYLGLLSTGASYLMQTSAQTVVPAAQAGIVMSMEGLFGTLFSLLLGLARFRPQLALGGILVTLAVTLSALPAGKSRKGSAGETSHSARSAEAGGRQHGSVA